MTTQPPELGEQEAPEASASDCLGCRLMSGAQPLPGGQIWGNEHWFIDHCVGPLSLGALVVLPIRHVLHLADLTPEEAGSLGVILHTAAAAAAGGPL